MTMQVRTIEDLAIGDLVHVYSDHGAFTACRANAGPTSPHEAHGFVWENVPAAGLATVYQLGFIPFLNNLTPGPQWLAQSAGKISPRPPSLPGQLVQQVGYAPASTVLNFQPLPAIKII